MNTSSRRALTYASYFGMFIFGMQLSLISPLLPYLFDRIPLEATQAGMLFFYINGGSLAVALLIGPAVDRFGFKAPFLVSSLVSALAMVTVAGSASYGDLAVGSFLIGIGGGGLNAGTNAFMADLYPQGRSAALNRLGVSFGIGAVLMPLSLAAFLRLASLKTLLWASGAVALASGGMFLCLDFPPPKHSSGGFPFREAIRALSHPLTLLLGVMLFFESGNETNAQLWLPTFVVEESAVSASSASFLMALFWAGLLLGRMLSPRLLRKVSEATLIEVGAGGAAGCLLLLVLFPGAAASAFAFGVGLTMAPVFPCAYGYIATRFPGFSGTLIGAAVGMAVTGGMFFPWLGGHVVKALGPGSGLIAAAVGFVVVVVLQAVIKGKDSTNVGADVTQPKWRE